MVIRKIKQKNAIIKIMPFPLKHYISIASGTLTSFVLIWLTLQKVQTGWGEEMPLMLDALMGLGVWGRYGGKNRILI